MADTQVSDTSAGVTFRDSSSSQPLARRSFFGTRSSNTTQPPRRFARLSPFWKALIITSFAINLVLIFVVMLLVGFVAQYFRPLTETVVGTQGFARDNVAELRSVVQGLENATIRTTIPIDQPLDLNGRGVVVPVDQATTVTLVEPVPLTLANADIDLGNGNRLRANNISLALPAGTQLNIALKMDIPLDAVTIPVILSVPIEIPLRDTELGPEFVRLGQLVDRLAGPFGPFLGIEIPEAPPAPRVAPQPAP
ncbi:MAG TPA: hypothetical protein PKA05_17350 [Roseiflexaceae bacterium]|nr:hypothetical protein [Roseiflexaceae bacterium]HMP42149.1 hypothetical protein [Roseiflexaceae bacterium]